MRKCHDCRFCDSSVQPELCTNPREAKIETDYVTGEQVPIYPTCQDMRLSRNVTHYCGAEGNLFERKPE